MSHNKCWKNALENWEKKRKIQNQSFTLKFYHFLTHSIMYFEYNLPGRRPKKQKCSLNRNPTHNYNANDLFKNFIIKC